MPTQRAPWSRALVLALLAGSLLESRVARLGADEAELLLSGQSRERQITAEETHVYRVEVAESPLLVTVEQRGIDLVVETRGPSGQPPVSMMDRTRPGVRKSSC